MMKVLWVESQISGYTTISYLNKCNHDSFDDITPVTCSKIIAFYIMASSMLFIYIMPICQLVCHKLLTAEQSQRTFILSLLAQWQRELGEKHPEKPKPTFQRQCACMVLQDVLYIFLISCSTVWLKNISTAIEEKK